MTAPPAITVTSEGLHCARGAFHIDPWGAADVAVLTHAHGDHARPGSRLYHCATPSVAILQKRLPGAELRPLAYGEPITLGDARVSLHPAGHVLGSAQIRIEIDGHVTVVSGDYKRAPDPTCAPFEVVPCDTFVTEATFALPIFRWDHPERVSREILSWWDACAAGGRAAVLYCYALGKAQRILAELARQLPQGDRGVLTHGMTESLTQVYRDAGVPMLPTRPLVDLPRGASVAGALVLAPILARGTPWTRRLGEHESAFASGFMRLRAERRRRELDRGFVLSDHADWDALLSTIDATGARTVIATHGTATALARHLRESRGIATDVLTTRFEGEADAAAEGSA